MARIIGHQKQNHPPDPIDPKGRERTLAAATHDTRGEVEEREVLRLAIAHELLAVEQMESKPDVARMHALEAFQLRATFKEEDVVATLETAAIGTYAGETDAVRAFLARSARPRVEERSSWDQFLLMSILSAWWSLLLGEWELAATTTASLLVEQAGRESSYLRKVQKKGQQHRAAWLLAGLYHWAQATHNIAISRLPDQAAPRQEDLSLHFSQALQCAKIEHASLIGWLQAAMVGEAPSNIETSH